MVGNLSTKKRKRKKNKLDPAGSPKIKEFLNFSTFPSSPQPNLAKSSWEWLPFWPPMSRTTFFCWQYVAKNRNYKWKTAKIKWFYRFSIA
jgi:hypothetical protein